MEGSNMLLLLTLFVQLAAIIGGQKVPPPEEEPGGSGPTGQSGPVGPQSCGTTSFTNTGLVRSPNYPSNYNNFVDCTYTLTSGANGRVQLTFNDFNLENGFDFLRIFSDGVYIGRYSGSTNPPVLTLGSSVTLRFTTDFSIVDQGFSISYVTIPANCGGLIFGSGVIQSPGFPGVYPANRQCVWGVVAPPGQSVTLIFEALNVERDYDWVELYEGSTRVARYTGSTVPPRAILRSAGRVVFSTDSSIQLSGIRITVSSAALTCGGSITGGFVINSPNYPNNYPNNVLCTWTYRKSPSAFATRLTFTDFDVFGGDSVRIYDGEILRNTLSGNVTPKPIQLRSDTITVIFSTNTITARPGFRLQFVPIA